MSEQAMEGSDSESSINSHPAIRRGLAGRAFWMLCSMEMWERLAYFGMRVVMPIYICQADEPGGLHFSQADKGSIYGIWFIFQSILPTFTGGFADRYGYKRNLIFAISMKVLGYVVMASQRSYGGFLFGVILLAIGTAQFKPAIQGSIAHTLGRKNSSVGWGLFYWLVNVGALIGHYIAGMLRAISWPAVFYGCAAIVSLNFLMLLTYPNIESGSNTKESPVEVFTRTIRNLVDMRLIAFLTIMSGFWLMMYQLWDLHPSFITDWIDSRDLAAMLPAFMHETLPRGVMVSQERILSLNAALIVVFIIAVAAMVRKMRTLSAMVGGMVVATLGIVVSGVSQSVWFLLAGIALFSAGEMLTGPKKNEYLALIAPKGKKALYLGYVNIPVGVGGYVGSRLAGWLYGRWGEKAVLAQRYLAEHTDYLDTHARPDWNGDVGSLTQTLGVERTDAARTLAEYLGSDALSVTNLLWETYQPYRVWYVFAAIGIASILGLVAYARAARRWKDMDY